MKRREAMEREARAAASETFHPSTFLSGHLLLQWPQCFLELRCGCGSITVYPVKLLAARYGNMRYESFLARARCQKCHARPNAVYLCASQHRTRNGGPEPDWAVELVTPTR